MRCLLSRCIIGGPTAYDADDQALLAILTQWGGTDSLQRRIEQLSKGGGRNGDVVLRPLHVHESFVYEWSSIYDDQVVDTLIPTFGENWVFQAPLDKLTRQNSTDVLTEVVST